MSKHESSPQWCHSSSKQALPGHAVRQNEAQISLRISGHAFPGRWADKPAAGTGWRTLRRGFTLIELLVVMSIVALLLTIAVPRYFGSLEKSKEVALKENLQVMRTAIDRFYTDKGRFPNDLGELASEKYFRTVPVDPVTESATTWLLVPSRDIEKPGIEDVKSGAPGTTRDKIPYSQL